AELQPGHRSRRLPHRRRPETLARGTAIQPASHGAAMTTYADRLETLPAEAADRCTGCGKCFEVCPTAREIGLDAAAAKARVGELSSLTRGGPAADGVMKWLNACDGSARCTDACPEDINVRQWV